MQNLNETMPNNNDSYIVDDEKIYNKKVVSIPVPEKNIGADTKGNFIENVMEAAIAGSLDISKLNNFLNVSRKRDEVYSLLDAMCEDSTVAAVLETYAEDATEYNDKGKIIWAESDDPKVAQYVEMLLDNLKVDKNAYKWAHSLCKYGDIYWELFFESDHEEDDLFNKKDKKNKLEEDVKINDYKESDHYVQYIEAVANPAELFELTKFGKTAGYIKTDILPTIQASQQNILGSTIYNYQFNKSDVNIFPATKFVHATLDDDSNRTEEEVQIFLNNDANADTNTNAKYTYKVKRGQSLLYNVFKIWRELALLENSMLLNRITKSSVLRIIQVQVGDMPKEMIGSQLQHLKSMIEQKMAINKDKSMAEYTNPGPMENTIYVPVHGDDGAITTDQIGGDVNIGQLSDVDYFQNKFFGAMRVPKQYFGLTDDGAGFNGGQSLSIISSRYAKMIKRIQNALLQGLTDLVNFFLIDRGLDDYINEFKLHMLPPTTQEEIDRRDNLSGKVQITSDIMNLVSDIQDEAIKLKILKSLLANVVDDSDIINYIQEEIDNIESNMQQETEFSEETEIEEGSRSTSSSFESDNEPLNLDSELGLETETEESEETESEEDNLPTPAELGIDMTDNTSES